MERKQYPNFETLVSVIEYTIWLLSRIVGRFHLLCCVFRVLLCSTTKQKLVNLSQRQRCCYLCFSSDIGRISFAMNTTLSGPHSRTAFSPLIFTVRVV